MDDGTTLELLGSAERASLLSLALHEQMEAEGRTDWARIQWVIYLENSGSAERIGQAMGVAPLTD